MRKKILIICATVITILLIGLVYKNRGICFGQVDSGSSTGNGQIVATDTVPEKGRVNINSDIEIVLPDSVQDVFVSDTVLITVTENKAYLLNVSGESHVLLSQGNICINSNESLAILWYLENKENGNDSGFLTQYCMMGGNGEVLLTGSLFTEKRRDILLIPSSKGRIVEFELYEEGGIEHIIFLDNDGKEMRRMEPPVPFLAEYGGGLFTDNGKLFIAYFCGGEYNNNSVIAFYNAEGDITDTITIPIQYIHHLWVSPNAGRIIANGFISSAEEIEGVSISLNRRGETLEMMGWIADLEPIDETTAFISRPLDNRLYKLDMVTGDSILIKEFNPDWVIEHIALCTNEVIVGVILRQRELDPTFLLYLIDEYGNELGVRYINKQEDIFLTNANGRWHEGIEAMPIYWSPDGSRLILVNQNKLLEFYIDGRL